MLEFVLPTYVCTPDEVAFVLHPTNKREMANVEIRAVFTNPFFISHLPYFFNIIIQLLIFLVEIIFIWTPMRGLFLFLNMGIILVLSLSMVYN